MGEWVLRRFDSFDKLRINKLTAGCARQKDGG
jgi:hypothetical protein